MNNGGGNHPMKVNIFNFHGGGGEIRTHGPAKRNSGFRNRPVQPLRHPALSLCPRADLNSQSSPPQGDALSIKLRGRVYLF